MSYSQLFGDHIHVQITIHRRLLIDRESDSRLDQSKALAMYHNLNENTGPGLRSIVINYIRVVFGVI